MAIYYTYGEVEGIATGIDKSMRNPGMIAPIVRGVPLSYLESNAPLIQKKPYI